MMTFPYSGRIAANGYRPIPISPPTPDHPADGKRPARGYQAWPEWSEQKHAEAAASPIFTSCGTGLLTETTPAVDLDVLDPVLLKALEDLAFKCLGKTPLRRVGRAPKSLLVYRCDAPFSKLRTATYRHISDPPLSPGFKGHAVEVLGAGQQFVAYGTHPDTLKPYRWSAQNPEDTPAAELPAITDAQAADFIRQADALFRAMGCEPVSAGRSARARQYEPSDPATDLPTARSAIAALPNVDVHYDDWVRVGMAIKGALGSSGLPLFDMWSAKSSKYDALQTARAFRSFRPTNIGAGTLYHLAKQSGWTMPGAATARAPGPTAPWRGPSIGSEAPSPTPSPHPPAAPPDPPQLPPPPPPPAYNPASRPTLRLKAGDEPYSLDEMERCVIASGFRLYQRAGMLVTPSTAKEVDLDGNEIYVPALHEVTPPGVTDIFSRLIQFERFDGRTKDWHTAALPPSLSVIYASRKARWGLPPLSGLITAPTLRSDGTILDQPGYDARTALLYDPLGVAFPRIPEHPTKEQATAALERLFDLIKEFPFAGRVDRAVVVSGMLTALTARTLPASPIHSYNAPVAGTGKTLLVDLPAILATGRRCPVMPQGQDEVELEKRLTAALLCGINLICIDNCSHPLDSSLLCQMATQDRVSVRPLGSSTTIEIPANVALFATGNNLQIVGDLTRRTLYCTIDSGEVRPEARTFERDCIELCLRDRPEYVTAALTVLRAYAVATDKAPLRPLGSFERWSRRVRDALVWLGEPDVCATIEVVRGTDPKLSSATAVLTEWARLLGPRRVVARDLLTLANDQAIEGAAIVDRHPMLKDALMQVASRAGKLSAAALSNWLGTLAGRPFEVGDPPTTVKLVKGLTAGTATFRLDGATAEVVDLNERRTSGKRGAGQ